MLEGIGLSTALNPLGEILGDNALAATASVTSTLIYWEIFGKLPKISNLPKVSL